MPFSQFDYEQMQARVERGKKIAIPTDACEKEVGKGGLHEQIESYCRNKGWIAIHARTNLPSTIAEGAHDFTIFADGGRVFCIECKAKGKKLSDYQMRWRAMMHKNGHHVDVVYSMSRFLEIVNESEPHEHAA